jgi:TatD-related deoxyribonuclease
MPARLPIFDNHIHLRADHRGLEAAKDFERAGGTAFLLTHTPYDDVPIRAGADYEAAYARTLAMAEAVRRATAIRVFVALGPYPVELVHLARTIGIQAAGAVCLEGVEAAAVHIAAGRAVAFGEVGRPHFPVSPEIVEECNGLVEGVLHRAKELDCAVVLHTEDPTPAVFEEYARMADRAGFDRGRLVKHHSTALTRREDNHGLLPSILAKEDLVTAALRGEPRFLLETDYIDDPRRPGAVLGPATVPRKTRAWMRTSLLTEEDAWRIHRDLPERTYHIALPG